MKNNALDTSGWREFKLGDLFDISGSRTTPKNKLEQIGEGKYPYITTQATNNGIAGYYATYTEKGHCLTIDSAVLGICFYQEQDFTASDHVEILRPKFFMSKEVAIFFTVLLNKTGSILGYAYNKKRSQTAIKTESIKLPVDSQGNINWHFMEESIKKTKAELEKILQSYKSLKLLAANEGVGWGKYLLIAYFIIILILQNLKSQNLKKTFWYRFIEILRAYALRMTLPVILSVAKNLRTQNLQKIFRLFQIPNMTRIT